jgi:hypothetical protein
MTARKVKGRDNFEELGLDARTILKWILTEFI